MLENSLKHVTTMIRKARQKYQLIGLLKATTFKIFTLQARGPVLDY